MGIMGCYADECAVENELGGKWELVDETTLEEQDALVYDEENGAPLNWNAVMFLITSATQQTIKVGYFVNDKSTSVITTNVSFNANSTRVYKTMYKNGFNISAFSGVSSISATYSDVLKTHVPSQNTKYVAISFSEFSNPITIKVYAMRGV